MNIRWAWTLPLLSSLTTTLIAGPTWAQGGPAGMQAQMYGQQAYSPMAAAQPVAMPAMYSPAAYPQAAYPQAAYPQAAYPQAAYQQAAYPQAAMYPQPGMAPPAGAYPQGMMPAAYMAGDGMQPPGQLPGGPAPDVYGSYGYAPSAPGGQDFGGPGYGPPQGYPPQGYGPQGYAPQMAPLYDQGGGFGGPNGGQGPMDGGCPYCGGQGCQQCGAGGGIFGHGNHHGDGTWLPNGLLGDVLGLVAPYPDGGCAAVRWYDFAVDYMMLKRDNTGRNQIVSSVGIAGPPALQTNDLNFGGYRPGFRFTGAYQIGPANSIEFTYFGQFNYTSHATVRSGSGNLFSSFSNFGLLPFGGFTEFDRADFNQINYQSTFDSFEINWRNRWMSPNCRYQGSWLLGVRHFILDEKFRFATSSSTNGQLTGTGFVPARSQDDTDTTNNLTGIQFGSDMWVCLLPGLRAGGELQAGVYGNHMNINTTAGSNQLPNVFRERLTANDVSFIGQANLLATYRLNYQWTLRGGYTFLFVDGVALASENFNSQAPLLNNPFAPRVARTNDNGNVFYHGWNVGLEFMW